MLDRGVWAAPWIGPNGEVVLLGVTNERKLALDPVTVPDGASRVAAADRIWDAIEDAEARRLRLI